MLDTFTGWYQARTEELPMQARAVFDALALNWDPMTAAALGLATGLDTPAVSSQLTRLEKSGYVETVALSSRGKGRSGYQVSERFFNIWYLMRNGSRRVGQSIRFLTQFVQACFNVGEQQTLAVPARAVGEAQSLSLVAFADSDAELPLIVEESRPHPDPLVRLPIPGQSGGPDWPAVFEAISSAMSGTDPAIGSTHIEDLQRLLWFILAQGQGQAFRQWMDKAGIRDRYAPLYHAFVAALDGEDHLLSINPEVRQPAARIHAGLARRLHPYGRDKLIRKSERSRRSG
jgi:hypothetical protein